MRLNDIFLTENRFKNLGQNDFAQVLRRAGYAPIDGGVGFFSRVYYKDGDLFALKIFFDWDHAYKRFVEFAMRNQNSPHIPKFRNGKIIRLNYNHLAIRVEILEPWSYTDDPGLVRSLHILTDSQIQKALKAPNAEDNNLAAGVQLAVAARDLLQGEQIKALNHIEEYPPSLLQIIEKMNKELFVDGYTSDIKADNIMLRGNNLVFIDPVRFVG